MQDTAKYLIHADIVANGVVERSDVVGAIFGQTEGLLGDGLDLRDLQQSSKVGRIDVEIHSQEGRSFGQVTIASGLDKVETAILSAALETIERVGPCRAEVEVSGIEDVRAAKRRRVVERAKELLHEFEGEVLTSQELVEEVRQSHRVEDITDYKGLPSGPRVADSDAIIVVEGRADVLTLLQYGIKNAVAVEGTDIPEAVAGLTRERTVTTFLDGDRGGDLIFEELTQVGDVDYVAFPPAGQSVEDLSRDEVMTALRQKVPYEAVADATTPRETVAATDGSTRPAPPGAGSDAEAFDAQAQPSTGASPETAAVDAATEAETPPEEASTTAAPAGETSVDATDEQSESDADPPETLAGHVDAVIGNDSGRVRLLDEAFEIVSEAAVDDALAEIEAADDAVATIVLDTTLTQRLLDVAAQREIEQIVADGEGEYVKKPTSVRIRTAAQILQ
jgi:DNA primase